MEPGNGSGNSRNIIAEELGRPRRQSSRHSNLRSQRGGYLPPAFLKDEERGIR